MGGTPLPPPPSHPFGDPRRPLSRDPGGGDYKLSDGARRVVVLFSSMATHSCRDAEGAASDSSFLLDHCFVCGEEEWGLSLTPCCGKPAHFRCFPAPAHIEEPLRHVCLIIDLDGFMVSKQFMARELGWSTIHGVAKSIHFELPLPYACLSPQNKKTVNYVRDHVHALPFDSRPEEYAVDLELLKYVVQSLYNNHRTAHQWVVAFKGGHVENDLLRELKIPFVNLVDYNCPKVKDLLTEGFRPILDCGHHLHSHTHLPQSRMQLFWEKPSRSMIRQIAMLKYTR